ncbi:threo-3-hydroxy-L-aspartate ammonia-lyase [Tanticharoenia sakaeratensis]|uniref:Pyridoxal-5'-phosphate-dependent protein subunit beta n=1 Tax=Tanticharoenia sakaeratensis NBRC 103193 TaxID=1231623 RepID=A0A0D6MGU6_9PROT|nr:threo-3-hydroxy-L-aspartate ammonia-lyase [Tanticharoenia sakaeratensis]GAN52854.1 pyridoxal-5'-phosphate-dependent protein subunit beta [Tanticharoenia sakaeratensis NBRC 103193]
MTIPKFSDVLDAAARIAPHIHRTPVLTSRRVDARVDATLFFKAETFQRTGSFKFRGATNAVRNLPGHVRGIVAYSSGNHAQAVALAAREAGLAAVIVMPRDAPETKRRATEGYGAQVIFYDRYTESREARAQTIADERGYALLPPFDHPDIIAGQGTAALELLEETGPLDLLLAPAGGGGLLSGSALAASSGMGDRARATRIVGVEPQAGDDMRRSLALGRIETIPVPRTIADGAQTTRIGDLTFPIIRDRVSAIATVPDTALVDTMRALAGTMKIVVEPTGCLAAAAALTGAVQVSGLRVGIILSGGNVDMGRFVRLLQEA